jgi:hypothetical protein
MKYFLDRLCILIFIASNLLAAPRTPLYEWPYQTAAVLPTYQIKQQKYVILAHNAVDPEKDAYGAFGGDREESELDPIKTAARIAYEGMIAKKTMGMTRKELKKYLASEHTQWVIASKVKNVGNVIYITDFGDHAQGLLHNFYSARQKTKKNKYQQKDRLAVVRWNDLEKAIKDGKHYVIANTINPRTHKREPSSKEIKLQSAFIKNLSGFFKRKVFKKRNSKIRVYED